ncbi:MAG: hypothetical protein GY816_13080 [Cytophagales bacterium]|nr:hypothetical protein [Cytophagales bacterium]
MTKAQTIKQFNTLIKLLDKVSDGTGHIGIALQASAYIKDYLTSTNPDAADQLYNDPFYSYFQNATNDLHSPYPIQKMAMLNVLEGYKRYLGS